MTEKPKYSLDRLVYWLMVTSLFVLALGCAPIQGLDWSSPSVKATFVFDVGFTTPYEMAVKNQTIIRQTITNRTITYPNGTVVVIATVAIITNSTGSVASVSGFLGDGFVTLEGRGGLSADNPLNISVTAYFRSNAFAGEPDIKFIPNGAYEANVISNPFAPVQPKTDARSFPIPAEIPLKLQNGAWRGSMIVIYNQAGSLPAQCRISGQPYNVTRGETNPILISPESVTVSARTNSLLVSLTWVIIGFSAIETHEVLLRIIRRLLQLLGKLGRRLLELAIWLNRPLSGTNRDRANEHLSVK